jgi:hypothetical protein
MALSLSIGGLSFVGIINSSGFFRFKACYYYLFSKLGAAVTRSITSLLLQSIYIFFSSSLSLLRV